MANNKTAVDQIHNALNPYFNTKENPNWKKLIETIGESDQEVMDLIEEVRKQFFITTSYRPYIDRLAANYKISRPKVVGMDDVTLRKYIPILAYKPKQVKTVIDDLLDIFFFKESTTAFSESLDHAPFKIKDKWELEYKVDGIYTERIIFSYKDFNNLDAVDSEEIAAAINRQAQYSFAISYLEKISKKKYLRIFTKTIGSKGSIEVTGGRADISLKFLGFIKSSGSGSDTVWNITKVGDTMRFTHSAGAGPNLFQVSVGDNVIIDIPNNSGTFPITNVNITEDYFEFQNTLGVAGTFNHATDNGNVNFIRPERSVVYTRDNRSIVWEVEPGKIVIEMMSTPPVVRRNLKGSAHLNGPIATMVDRISDTSMKIDFGKDWPNSGKFVLQTSEEVKSRIITPDIDQITTLEIDTEFDARTHKFSYASKVEEKDGDNNPTGYYILSGIVPDLPVASGVTDLTIDTIESDTLGVITVKTVNKHNIQSDGSVMIFGITPTPDPMNGIFQVIEILDDYTFKCQSGSNATPPRSIGTVRIERIGLADSGSQVYLTSSISNTGIYGPYMYDTLAPFVVSSYVGKITEAIYAGNIVLNLQVETPNNIPNEQGYLIFDYGLNTQEGPVRYLYKASEGTIALDPSYIFKYNHSVGATITAIRRKGAHVLSGLGKEYAFYVSDPSMALQILRDLISNVKSAGVFLEYMIRYPQLYYSDFDVYSQTDENASLLGL